MVYDLYQFGNFELNLMTDYKLSGSANENMHFHYNIMLPFLTITFAVVLPFMAPDFNSIQLFDIVPKDAMDFFANIVRRAIDMRKESQDIQGRVCITD